MILFPNAKINLGLNVLRKRNDGYHDLETVFYPVPLHDILEVVLTSTNSIMGSISSVAAGIQSKAPAIVLKSGVSLTYSASGLAIEGITDRNLCIRACALYDERFGISGDLSIHLHKIIPMGAGLGGGSADAAFMLKALNEISGAKASQDEMLEMAASLGSDCSFFIINTPAFASGRGEVLQKCKISLAGYKVVIVKPPIHISTNVAFDNIQPCEQPVSISQVVSEPLSEWKQKLKNDFEVSIFNTFPEIAAVKKLLIENGAVYASMTGSGAAVYGLFKESVPPENLFKDSFYFKSLLEN